MIISLRRHGIGYFRIFVIPCLWAISWVLRRYQPFSILVWAIPASLFVLTLLVMLMEFLILGPIRRKRERVAKYKLEGLKVGMTEKELIQILGEPHHRYSAASKEIAGIDEEIKKKCDNIWEYTFSPRRRFSSGPIWLVYVDDKERRVVHIRTSEVIVD